jgi:hypothetical protein
VNAEHLLIIIGGVLAAGSGLFAFGRGAWRWFRRLSHFIDDVTGEEPRNGQPRRPGLVEQVDLLRVRQEEIGTIAKKAAEDVAAVRHELTVNGGDSVKDVVNRTAIDAAHNAGMLMEHLRKHEDEA